MKKDWDIKKLGDVCEVKCGATPLKSDKSFWENGTIPWFTVDDIRSQGRIIKSTSKTVTEKALKKLTLFPKNTILLCCTASVGEYALTDIELTCNQQFNGLIIKNTNYLTPNYLFHFASTLKERLLSVSGKTTIDFVSNSKVCDIEIPVPPLEEQKRIVKILDEKFAQLETIKANAQTNLQNAKDLFQSELTKAFSNTTWEKAKLEDIALDFSRGKSKHRPRNDKCLFGGNYPFIQTGDIRNADKYVTDYSETYNETGLAQSKLWPAGTLCITIAANIAETAILSFPCCFPDSVIGFIPNEKLTTVDFVYYLIQFFKSELQNLSKGAAQDNLNLAKFENMNFPLPPLPEQKRIVKELDALSEKVRQLQEIYTKQIANCAELKQSLLQKAFEGEL